MEPINMMPVEVHFKPSGKYWLALCPSLGLTTQGENFERAEENLREMLWLFFESCLNRGVLEQVLNEAGFSKTEIDTVKRAADLYSAAPSIGDAICRA